MSVYSAPLLALLQHDEASGQAILRAPTVGLWRNRPRTGAWIGAGDVLGVVEQLGASFVLLAPPGTRGIVVDDHDARRVLPVEYGQALCTLESPTSAPAENRAHAAPRAEPGALHFRAPISGRFYDRAAPDAPPFVQPGDEVRHGQTVALLEVMKTFNRIAYGGIDVPEVAIVRAVVARNGDDVAAGEPILELTVQDRPPDP